MTSGRLVAIPRAALPIVAMVAFAASAGAIVMFAGPTLGYDFEAYFRAAQRVVEGAALYDQDVAAAGGFAIYLYPPPFAVALVPFALLPGGIALLTWETVTVCALLLGVALMPVSRTVRWLVLLSAAIDWPVLYTIKIGQVGTLLLLLFVAGWRWMDRPWRLGAGIAVGALIKVQPVVLLIWAMMTGRRKAAGIAIGIVVGAALVVTLLFGPSVWTDYAALLARVNAPITTPHNFTLGAIAFQLGAPVTAASLIQLVSTLAAITMLIVAIRRCTNEASYLVTVIVSQLVSPVLWDHYAMLLLLPVAYLLSAGRWWALLVPLATAWPLVGITPPVVYPLVFWSTLVAVAIVGRRTRPGATPA